MGQAKHALCDRANQQSRNTAATMRGHDDQLGLKLFGKFCDFASGIANPHVKVGFAERACRESLAEGPLCVPAACFVVNRGPDDAWLGDRDLWQYVNHVQVRDIVDHLAGRFEAPRRLLGKVKRYDDAFLGEPSHVLSPRIAVRS
jgi:hypothetical protein